MSDSLHDHWKLIGSAAGAVTTCIGWLLRRPKSSDESWLSRVVNREMELIRARRTISDQTATIRIRDEEIAYLMGANERARATAEVIQEGIVISALKSAKPPDDSTISPPGFDIPSKRSSPKDPLGIPS